jgi:hypothetical protein
MPSTIVEMPRSRILGSSVFTPTSAIIAVRMTALSSARGSSKTAALTARISSHFNPTHNAVGFGDSIAGENQLAYRGRWYAGGQLLVIHYDTAEKAASVIIRILEIAPDTIRVRWDGREMRMTRSTRLPPQASNQPLERTVDRRKDLLVMTSTLKSDAQLAVVSGRSAWSR